MLKTKQDSPRKIQRVAHEPSEIPGALRVRATKRKATSMGGGGSCKKFRNEITNTSEPVERASEQQQHINYICTDKLSELPVAAVRVGATKRRASVETDAHCHKFRHKFTNTSKSVEKPGEQQQHSNNKGTDEPSELPVVTITLRATKSQASTAAGAHCKKSGCENTHTSETVGGAGEAVLNKASAEQLPATQNPETSTERGCDVSPSFSSPSASRQNNESLSFQGKTSRADFRTKYLQLKKLGKGGFGSVYAGIKRADNSPVAIKHIPQANVERQLIILNGMRYMVPTEVFLLLQVAGPETVGRTAVVSLLDWYDLEQEVLLIMERPVPAVDLLKYLENNNGPLKECTAKIIMKQLVEAAIEIQSKGVFHRDIKVENVLIQSTSDGLRVRIIDFGCGCLLRNRPFHTFAGTSAYAPPEFYMYGTYRAAPTTVWQLGALLYEITDGYRQFKTTKFLHKWIKFNKKLSKDCLDLVHRCLVVNPMNRFTLEQILLHPWIT